jgi:hypothetical protein
MVGPKLIAPVLALACLVTGIPAVAVAAAAPAQLLNKTIVISWSRDVTEKRGDGTIINIHRNDTRQIYVSTAGRLFIRRTAQIRQLQRTKDVEPGTTTTPEGQVDMRFQGNRLVLTRTHYSGATQLTIDFDPGFTTCTMKVVSGKEAAGAPIVWRGMNGRPFEVISNTVTSSSCEIRDGNLFAGQ